MTAPLALDLFSGCGGVSEGLRQAGYAVAGAIEIDGLAAETYAENHPDAHLRTRDIRDVTPRAFRRRIGVRKHEMALLTACAPCQGFSRMRTLNRAEPVADPRNGLVMRVLPFVEEFAPLAVMLENVPGARDTPEMQLVRGYLERRGYQLREGVLDVAEFGVPQRRRRYILLAALNRQPRFARRARAARTVRETIEHLPLPGESDDPAHDVSARYSARVARLISRVPLNGGSRKDLSRRYQLDCHATCDGFHDVYGRMEWDTVAPTITSGFVNPSKGRFLHPDQNRAITPREAALLQGFPSDYYFSMRRGKYAAAEMIGNAVPPEFARRQARAIRAAL